MVGFVNLVEHISNHQIARIVSSLIQNDFSELEDYVVNNPEQQQIWNVMILALYNCLYIQKDIEVTERSNIRDVNIKYQ